MLYPQLLILALTAFQGIMAAPSGVPRRTHPIAIGESGDGTLFQPESRALFPKLRKFPTREPYAIGQFEDGTLEDPQTRRMNIPREPAGFDGLPFDHVSA